MHFQSSDREKLPAHFSHMQEQGHMLVHGSPPIFRAKSSDNSPAETLVLSTYLRFKEPSALPRLQYLQ